MPYSRTSKCSAVLLAAAFLAVLFVASGAALWHVDAPGSEATCTICHLAHMPVLPGMSSVAPAASALVVWLVPAEEKVAHTAPAGLDSPPRAPPV
jgi:hypothetical protein